MVILGVFGYELVISRSLEYNFFILTLLSIVKNKQTSMSLIEYNFNPAKYKFQSRPKHDSANNKTEHPQNITQTKA